MRVTRQVRRCEVVALLPLQSCANTCRFEAPTHSKVYCKYPASPQPTLPVHGMAEASAEQIAQGLSQAGTTLDGTGVAFLKLSLTAKGIASFGSTLSHLQHVRVINASGNGLKAVAAPELSGCRSLVTLSLAHNRIRRLDDLSQLRHLQVGSAGTISSLSYNASPFAAVLTVSDRHFLCPHAAEPRPVVQRHCLSLQRQAPHGSRRGARRGPAGAAAAPR